MTEPVTLITGTSKGIGRALAEHFASRGHTVIGCSRQACDWTAANYTHRPLDVADEKAVTALFAEIRRTHHRLDNLINNAAVASMNHSLLTPVSVVDSVLRTNVTGLFLFCREAGKMMRTTGGRIVNFTSVAHPLRLEGEAAYAASKAAVESMTRILARELGPMGITVNALGPTPVATDLIRGISPEKIGKIMESQAIRRMGTMQDVIHVVEFFLDRRSDFVTGQVVYLGGVS